MNSFENLFSPICGMAVKSVSETSLMAGLIGRPGPYPVEPKVCACSGKFTTTENVISRFSDRGMDPASTINFFSNEDTQELAPGYLHCQEAALEKAA